MTTPWPSSRSTCRSSGAEPRRGASLVVTVAWFAVAGALYGLLAPRWYRSVAHCGARQAQPKGGGLSSLLGGDLGALAAGLDGSSGAAPTRAGSRRCCRAPRSPTRSSRSSTCRSRYDEKYQETAREELWKHCDVRTASQAQPRPALLRGQGPALRPGDARVLRRVREPGVPPGERRARRRRRSGYLEKRVAELRQQADEAAARMREFQEKHQIVDLDSQAKAVVSSVADAERPADREADGARLRADLLAPRTRPGTRQLESQLSVVDETLRDLEDAAGRTPASRRRPWRSGKGKAEGSSSRRRWRSRSFAPSTRSSTGTGRSPRRRWSSRWTAWRAPGRRGARRLHLPGARPTRLAKPPASPPHVRERRRGGTRGPPGSLGVRALEEAGGSGMTSARRVLVTGGLGFIGLELTRQLASRGHLVRILDNLSPQITGRSRRSATGCRCTRT